MEDGCPIWTAEYAQFGSFRYRRQVAGLVHGVACLAAIEEGHVSIFRIAK